jgi:hypothetical protein
MKRKGKITYQLIDFDEASDAQCQEHCQSEINDVLLKLQGLVTVTEMPEGSRADLYDGLRHIRCHITMQTQLLTSDISGRAN